MEEEERVYGHGHRAFLQAFMARGTMTFQQARPVLAAIQTLDEGRNILETDITEADFQTYIAILNNSISPFDLEIRSTYTQTAPRSQIYALVNMTSDAMTQMATTHTPDEVAFLKLVLDEMFISNNKSKEIMAVKGMQAVRLHKDANRRSSHGANEDGTAGTQNPQQLQNFSMTQAERLLKSLVAEGWFERQGDWYTLSPRALMELRTWLVETYNEPDDDEEGEGVERIKKCRACREIITSGQRCPTVECPCRLHDNCTQGFFRMQRSTVCPLCLKEWSGQDFVGIRAAENRPRRNEIAS